MADGAGQGALDWWARFLDVGTAPGGEQTLLAPDVTSHGGEGVAEGRTRFAVPGIAGRGFSLRGLEPDGQKGDEGEQGK